MKDFKDEVGTFKTQAELDRREMNRRRRELAHKTGTLVEGIVTPNLPRVARELFDCKRLQGAAMDGRRPHEALRRSEDAGDRRPGGLRRSGLGQ